jgi:hypothetical protein
LWTVLYEWLLLLMSALIFSLHMTSLIAGYWGGPNDTTNCMRLVSPFSGAGTHQSSYWKLTNPCQPLNKSGNCCYCGKAGHGSNTYVPRQSTTTHRRANCPDFNAVCSKCSRRGH